MIKKILIIRKSKIQTDTLKSAGLDTLVVGVPLRVAPAAWPEEVGLSHFGFVLEMKLKDSELLNKWIKKGSEEANASTVLDLPDLKDKAFKKWLDRQEQAPEQPVLAYALYKVGLRIHPSAE